MKRHWRWVGLMALVLCISVSWMTGCAKKATLQEGAVVTQEQKAVAARAPAEVGPSAQKSRIPREQALLDQGHDEVAWARNRCAHFVVFSPMK
jgi:hypothetical protein